MIIFVSVCLQVIVSASSPKTELHQGTGPNDEEQLTGSRSVDG